MSEATFKFRKNGEIKVMAVLKEKQKELIDRIAWWDRKDKKQIIQEAIQEYIDKRKDVPL
jgi:uncharacterized protein YlzI (FlbEa/FlbD family)